MAWGDESNVLILHGSESNNPENPSHQDPEKMLSLSSPYIQLAARLSQTWLNQCTIMLLLVIFRLLFTVSTLKEKFSDGEADVNAECLHSQAAASVVASLPHYLALSSNVLVKESIDTAVTDFASLLIRLLTAVEAVVSFVISSFRSTYMCLLNMAIEASLSAVIETVDVIEDTVNLTMSAISKDLAIAVKDANSVLQNLGGVLHTLTALTGEEVSIPLLTLPTMDTLGGLTFTVPLEATIRGLKSEVNREMLGNLTETIIALPFIDLKQIITNTLMNYSFDAALLEAPPLVHLSLCRSSSVNNFFMSLNHDMHMIYLQIIASLTVIAMLAVIFNICLQWWRWNGITKSALVTGLSIDAIDSVLIAVSPVRAKLRLFLRNAFVLPEKQRLAEWFIAYVLHSPVAYIFSLVIVGSLSISLQTLMHNKLKIYITMRDLYSPDFYSVVSSNLKNSSGLWAQAANFRIASTEQELNTKIFYWVRESTSLINATLNEFTDELLHSLNSTFKDTVLYEPAVSVMNCIFLVKVRGIENGLNWVHEQAHIELPVVPSTLFDFSTAEELLTLQSGGNQIISHFDDAMTNMMRSWQSSIHREILIVSILLSIWSLVALCGIARVLYFNNRGKIRTMLGNIVLIG